MSFKKNTAITGLTFGLVNKTDGSDVTTGIPVGYYTLDGGTQAAIADVTPVHEGNGQWSVDITAGEMNGDIVGLVFTHTSAITTHFTIKTNTKLVSDLNDIAATSIVSSGAITTNAGAVSNVTTVATTTTNTDMKGTDNAMLASSYTAPDNASIASILVDTGTTIPNQISGLNGISVVDILTTQMTESYAADGIAPTLAQCLFNIQQNLGDFSYSGVTQTVKGLDGVTAVMTYTLDDAGTPTSKTRAS